MNEELKNAVLFHNLDKIKYLQKRGINLHEVDDCGYTVMHIASELGYSEVVEFLLEQGADVNQTTNWEYTVLHHAAAQGKVAFVEMLLKKGADVSIPNDGGCIPLHYAASNGRTEAAELLAFHGADINAADKENMTPLDKAKNQEVKDAMLRGHERYIAGLRDSNSAVAIQESSSSMFASQTPKKSMTEDYKPDLRDDEVAESSNTHRQNSFKCSFYAKNF